MNVVSAYGMLSDLIVYAFDAKQNKDAYRKGGYKIIINKYKKNKVDVFINNC